MERRERSKPELGDPRFLRMLRIAPAIRLVDLALTLLVNHARKTGAEGLASGAESATRHEIVQCGHVLFCQTDWYLNCHTKSIPV